MVDRSIKPAESHPLQRPGRG